MPDSLSLTADELRAFHRRIMAMRVSIVGGLVVALVSVISLGHLSPVLWIAPVVPAMILSHALHFRASRCPRCRKSVWSNPPPDEDGTPGLTLFGHLHPDHCRACGVRLSTGGPPVPR